MERKLFCEIHPAFYRVSVAKGRALRHLQNLHDHACLATERRDEELPNLVKGHTSIILRKLEGVDMQLQESKKVNLALAAQDLRFLMGWSFIRGKRFHSGFLLGSQRVVGVIRMDW